MARALGRGHGTARGRAADDGGLAVRGDHEGLTELGKLQGAFALEMRRGVGCKAQTEDVWRLGLLALAQPEDAEAEEARGPQTPGPGGADADDSGPRFRVRVEYVRACQLAGVLTTPDGAKEVALPGYGRGVPPSACLDHCVVVALRGRPSILLTGSSDGENLLWAPSANWDRLQAMPFYSVFAHFRGSARQGGALRAIRQPLPARTTNGGAAGASASGLGGYGNLDAKAIAARMARAQAHREAEALRRERDADRVQTTHLDPEREEFIKGEMRTTVLQRLDFEATRRVHAELDRTRLLFGLPAAGAEAIPNTSRGLLNQVQNRALSARAPRASASAPTGAEAEALAAARTLAVLARGRDSARRVREDDVGWEGAMRTLMREPTLGQHTFKGHGNGQCGPSAATVVGLGPGSPTAGRPQVAPPGATPRQTLQLTCLAVHPQAPRAAAGVGDGQLAVYHLYRAHGQRRPQLHQTQGFDASRGCGDVATAVYVPSAPLAQEGVLKYEAVIAGFESGRIAVFQVLLPAGFGAGKGLSAGLGADNDEGDKEQADGAPAGGARHEPVLTATEPLLLEHYHCRSPVRSIFWHHILGILSVGTDGTVLVADSGGAATYRIPMAAGRNTLVSCAALSTEHEQLAVAGQRGVHLWQCFSQARMGVLELPGQGSLQSASPAKLVRYLPSQRFLLSVHEVGGAIALWDVQSLELHRLVQTKGCLRATSVAFDPAGFTLSIFGPMGVVEQRLIEEAV